MHTHTLTTRRLRAVAFTLACLPLVAMGCATEGVTPTGSEYPETGEVTYYEHVKPIFKQRCNSCHQKGAIAPFALGDLDTARLWGKAAAAAVTARSMPPFLVKGDDTCGTFKDNNWLSDAEIQTIQKWVDLNMPKGDASKDPGEAEKPASLQDANEYVMPVEYLPTDDKKAGGIFDDYRCFPIQLGLNKDQFVTAVDVIPGNAEVVHHVLAFAIAPESLSLNLSTNNQQVMDALAKKHSTPERGGWPCFAAAGEDVQPGPMIIGWAPGAGVTHYPKGTGIKVNKDDVLVVQVHYNVVDKPGKDRTKLRIKFEDKVDAEAWFVLHDPFLFGKVFGNQNIKLNPGKAEEPFTWSATRAQLSHSLPGAAGNDLRVHGVFPHMHKRGRKMHMTVKQDGGTDTCAADVGRWDFNWQRMYYYTSPIKLDAKTKFTNTCTYDTSKDVDAVFPGFGTDNEMCLMGFYISKPLP